MDENDIDAVLKTAAHTHIPHNRHKPLNTLSSLPSSKEKLRSGIKERIRHLVGMYISLATFIDDDVFTKTKSGYREQTDGVEDEIHKLYRTKNLKMDVTQDVLALMRNIGKTYQKAPDDLKRLYLGLFWDQFKAEDKVIVEATKSPIVLGLEETGALIWNKGILQRMRQL